MIEERVDTEYKGEINGHGEKEGLPTEYQYEFEQEMLKHVHDLKNDLREKGWWEKETPEISQTSFLRIKKTQMQNWGLSLNNPILLKLLNIYLKI